MGSASGAVMCHCSFPFSLSLFPDVIQLSISSIFPFLQDIIPLLILSSSTLSFFFTSPRSLTLLLSSFFFLLFQLIVSETVINLDWPGWDRRAVTLTDGEEFTGLQVELADWLGLHCAQEELLSEDARWWADVLLSQAWWRGENGLEQWFYKLPSHSHSLLWQHAFVYLVLFQNSKKEPNYS